MAMDCEPKKTKLEEMAEQPKSVTGDQGAWTNHSLKAVSYTHLTLPTKA